MELSIKLGVPYFEIETWPLEAVNKYMALNLMRPFTHSADFIREGFIIELLRNQNCTKKSQYRDMTQLIPYTSLKLPDYMEHPDIRKLKKAVDMALTFNIKPMIDDIKENILDEISIQLAKQVEDRDEYIIKRCAEIYRSLLPKEESTE